MVADYASSKRMPLESVLREIVEVWALKHRAKTEAAKRRRAK